MRFSFLLIAALTLGAASAFAQLPKPNAAGATAGHTIFTFTDPAAAQKFWETLGGHPGELGPLKLTVFPGVLFYYPRAGHPKGGTEGSTIGYIGFGVKNLKDTLAKLETIGVKPLPGATSKEAFVMAPDDVKVRLKEDKSLETPVAAGMINMVVPDVAAAKAWYAKYFGAKMIKRNGEMLADLPGEDILFTAAKGPVEPTRGRAFDRIGIEVSGDLAEVCNAVGGSKVNQAKQFALAVCTVTDPWGTFIEISHGLSAVK